MKFDKWVACAGLMVLLGLVVVPVSGKDKGTFSLHRNLEKMGARLILYLPFDEGKGLETMDKSGKGHNGEIKEAEWTKGKKGKALYFDGESSYVEVEDSELLNPLEGVIIEAWIKPDTLEGQHYIVSKGRGHWASGYNLLQRDDKVTLKVRTEETGNEGWEIVSEGVLKEGTWSHIIGVYNTRKNEAILYCDGKEVVRSKTEGEIEYIYDDLPLVIGVMAYNRPKYVPFKGSIDEVKVYILSSKGKGEEKMTRDEERDEEMKKKEMEKKGKGNIAIFRDKGFPASGIASSPDYLKRVLKEGGYKVGFLNANELADKKKLNRLNYDLLVLPYGASFPVNAVENFQKFLKKGGNFFSMGGYAFNNPVEETRGKWMGLKGKKEKIVHLDFEDMEISAPGSIDDGMAHKGNCSLKIDRDGRWAYEVTDIEPGQRVSLGCWMKTKDVRGDHFAFISPYQYRKDGSLASHGALVTLTGTNEWKHYKSEYILSSETAKVVIYCGLWEAEGTAWFDEIELYSFPPEVVINSSRGSSRTWGTLNLRKEQIAVFDPSYKLEEVSYLRASPGQHIVNKDIKLEGDFTGFAAIGVLGRDRCRWIPLVNAYDKYGRPKGSAGAIMYNYSGHYRKSCWAFFGVDNADLFREGNDATKNAILEITHALMRETFLHNLQTDYCCYRQKEPVNISIKVSNYGWQEQDLKIKLQILDEKEKNILLEKEKPVSIRCGKREKISFAWSPEKFSLDFYKVKAILLRKDKIIDSMENGFVVWNEAVQEKGLQLSYKNNYLYAKDKPMFIFGTDARPGIFKSTAHNPLTWKRDLQRGQDFGLNVFENLQFYNSPKYGMPEKHWRSFDGFIQLCQRYKQVYFPSLLCCSNVAVSDKTLKLEEKYCASYARRYRDIPGLIYYPNGDIVVKPDNKTEDIKRLWNDYLKERYKTTRRLKEAWKEDPPAREIGDIDYRKAGGSWTNIKRYDCRAFGLKLMNRWNKAIARAIRGADAEAIISNEYGQWAISGNDVLAGIDHIDICNIGYFDLPELDIARFPKTFRSIDQRAIGKSMNIGEFGVIVHPAFELGKGIPNMYKQSRSPEERNRIYLAIAHYALGMGGSKIQNWEWTDSYESVSPWGINYSCDGLPKDTLYLYRDCQLFFRPFDLTYKPLSVYCIIPESHRWGFRKVLKGTRVFMHYLIASHLDFASLVETRIKDLPKEAKVLFYPIPFCPTDEVYNGIRDFVKNGGTLILTGDISYDEFRKRTRTKRLEELCGVKFISEVYPNIKYTENSPVKITPTKEFPDFPKYEGNPCIKIKPTTAKVIAKGSGVGPVVVVNKLGKGKVIYSTDIPEMWSKEFDLEPGVGIARAFLKLAGVKPNQMNPNDPEVHLFKLPTLKNETIYTFFNTKKEKVKVTVPTPAGKIQLELGPQKPGLICVTKDKKITSLEVTGEVKRNGRIITSGDAHFMLMSMDNLDIQSSKALLYMPITTGTFRLNTKAKWLKPSAEIGELRGCKWTVLESLTPKYEKDRAGATLTLTTDEVQKFDIYLINEKEELPRYATKLEGWYSSPETITR